jgi:hypothetical protein
VIAQAARRSHHDMGAALQLAALLAHVHAAHAAGHDGTGIGIEPCELTLDLHGEFAGGRDDEAQGALG